ncbi:hypothetical protein HWV62_30797 [Athelia sp. TMB]|nr:hypothetical protein HWV62_30797 [Athelia sp. TMB]
MILTMPAGKPSIKRKKVGEDDAQSEADVDPNTTKKKGKMTNKPGATAHNASEKSSKSQVAAKPKATTLLKGKAKAASATSQIVENNTNDLRRSKRTTKGEGGTAAQLQRVGEAVKHVPKRKKATVINIPETNVANPMAPEPPKRRAAARKPALAADTADTPPLTPLLQFLVPPGTEPSLAVPPLGSFTQFGHEYGFPAGFKKASDPRNTQRQAPARPPRPDMNIDPSLLKPSGFSKKRAMEGKVVHRALMDEAESTEDEESSDENELGGGQDEDESMEDEEDIEDVEDMEDMEDVEDTPVVVDGENDGVHEDDASDHNMNDQGAWSEVEELDAVGRVADHDDFEMDGGGDPAANGQSSIHENGFKTDDIPCLDDLDLPPLVVDPKYFMMGQLAEMFGPKRKDTPQLYEDSRVTDMLNAGVFVDGTDMEAKRLRNLLREIKADWIKDNPEDATFATLESTNERIPAGAVPGYDVLQRHRLKNGVPKVRHQKARLSQANEQPEDEAKHGAKETEAKDNEDEEDLDNTCDDDSATCGRARRHSKKAFNSRSDDPSQAGFYPDTWQEVLSTAKMHWRVRLATEWGFPKFREQKGDILTCLTQAITEYEDENGSLVEGTLESCPDMIKLLWEDSSSFRGELKKLARVIVPLRYNIFPPQGKDDPKLTHEEYVEHVKDTVAGLILAGDFMHDGKDANGRTNNLTHPAVAELCTSFYYGTNSRIGHEYEELFGLEVPPLAVALVIAAIKCCLDEWAKGTRKGIPFQADVYRPQYEGIVTSVNAVVASKTHGQKFQQARRAWASNGTNWTCLYIAAAPYTYLWPLSLFMDRVLVHFLSTSQLVVSTF